MLNHIANLDQIETEAMDIDAFLNVSCSEDLNEAAYRGNELSVFMARTGKLLADAKYWQDIAIHENTLLVKETYKSMPPTIQKKLIESMSKKENFMVTWIDRLNRTCTHQQQFMITLISKGKEEMKLAGYGGNVRNDSSNTW